MFQALFKKGLQLSVINIWRNKFLSLATIFVIGIIIFIFNIILGINFIAQKSLYELGQKVDLIVYLKDTTTEAEAQNLINDVKTLPAVKEAIYTSKEQALSDLKATHPDLSLSFEKYNLENPLPASLNISTENPTDHQKVADFLNQDQYQNLLSTVNTGDNSIISSISKNLSALGRFTNQIIFWLIITFLVGGTLIILNALQMAIFARRQEIEVMKLVGASIWFIRMPFIIEATIYAIMANIFAFLMVFSLTQIPGSAIAFGASEWTNILLIELAITIFISVVSSLIAVHEHLFRKSL